jgi:hypothetical protein
VIALPPLIDLPSAGRHRLLCESRVAKLFNDAFRHDASVELFG